MVLNITCCNSNLLDTYRRTMTYHGLSTHSSSRLEGVLKPIVCALACALPSLAWSAPTTPTDDVAAQAVVVTATRTDKPLQEASGSLAVISAERLAAESPSTLFEALGTIPNVNVESADSVISGKVSIRGGDFNQNIDCGLNLTRITFFRKQNVRHLIDGRFASKKLHKSKPATTTQ